MSNKMLGAEAREANKAWLMQQVNVVMEPLMLSILNDKPSNTVSTPAHYSTKQEKKAYWFCLDN